MLDFTSSGNAGDESGHSVGGTHRFDAALVNNRAVRKGRAGASSHRKAHTQTPPAGSATNSSFETVDHRPVGTHYCRVGGLESNLANGETGVDDHLAAATHVRRVVDPELLAEIKSLWRMRQKWHRAEKSLTLQARAICRSMGDPTLDTKASKKAADKLYKAATEGNDDPLAMAAAIGIAPLITARDHIEKPRLAYEKAIGKLAKKLAVAPWIVSVKGISLISLGGIVGEAGDLSVYDNPAKLWKRMGLAVMPEGRQRKSADKDIALAHGYSPKRRSEMWNIGNGLVGGMGKGKRPLVGEDISLRTDWSPLEKLFVERLRYEAAKDPSHAREPTDEGKESYSKHAANRAKRYVEKRFLLLLWREWRRSGGLSESDTQVEVVPAPNSSAQAECDGRMAQVTHR